MASWQAGMRFLRPVRDMRSRARRRTQSLPCPVVRASGAAFVLCVPLVRRLCLAWMLFLTNARFVEDVWEHRFVSEWMVTSDEAFQMSWLQGAHARPNVKVVIYGALTVAQAERSASG